VKHRLYLTAALLLAVALAGSACRKGDSNPFVGRWRNYDGLFHIDFTAEGECIYDIADRPEYFPHLVHGVYEVTGKDTIVITIDHELSGEFRFKIEQDVLQLTDQTGRSYTYMRMKPTLQ
jgi:hypothetical protein